MADSKGPPADLLGHAVETRVRRGSIPAWVERYGYGTRQIKNWLALGREVGEMPPFDEPEKLADWAAKHLERVPGRLLEAIEKLTGAKPVVESAAGPGGEAAAPAPEKERIELPDISGMELSLEAELLRFRTKLAMIHTLHEEALKKQEFNAASRYLDQAQAISGEVRQLEKLVQTQRAELGEWMRTGEVKQAVGEFLGVMKRALVARGERARGRFATEDAGKVWKDEIGAAFADLCQSGFAEGLVLEG